MGIAAVKAFDVPRDGPLGVDQFWRHSLYCAFLSASLARRCGAEFGMAYTCGLLHNFGLLLITKGPRQTSFRYSTVYKRG
jgi:HD-like signal output (HDOD) protein